MAFMMDTLLRPVGVALLVFSLAPKHRRIVFFVTLGVITLNSIIGITESILVSRLIPYKIHGFSITEDFFRSTALLGHPLSNALITAVGLIFALGYLRSNVARIIIGAILITGLLSFGGCTALAAALLSVFLMLAIGVVQDLRNGHFKYGESALLAVALLVAPFLISVMVGSTNIGSRIIGYLRWGASADARLESLNLFQYISMDDLIFGMPVERLGEMTNDIGTIGTIENFWVVLIARMGLIGFGIFFIALAAFCYRLMQEGKLAAKVAVIMFLFIASSNNSLSSKSPALCVLVLLIVSGASYLQNRSIRGNGADKKGSKSLPRGFRSQQTAGTRRPRSNPNLRPTS
ncbi:MAG: hypothetical protein HOF11_01305 [Rhodospirillaceae bacterium]|nr:hypothetical protein [Rhodospirillaceae bacterium]